MAAIQPIKSSSIHKITSGQVVIDLQTAVKELLENSVDAGSNSIEIRFKEFGLKSIEVVDNGTGIAPANYATVALKHHTSKLTKFEDLTTIESYGFRGEALASLCAVSESASIITATSEEAPMGTILELDRTGALKDSSGKIARQRGTTVTVSGLFKALPVRRAELARNIKREYSKTLHLLNAYALYPCVEENSGIRMTVTNQTDAGKKTVQLRTTGHQSVPDSIKCVWGPKSIENISPFDLSFTVQPPASHIKRKADASSVEVKMVGFISDFAHGKGRTSNDRQFLYINRRPCNLPKIQKVINEVYKTFNTNQYPFVIANLSLALDAYDVNVSPDKRTIFLHNEENLMIALREALESKFSSSRSTFALNKSANTNLYESKPLSQSNRGQPESQPLFLDSDTEMEREEPNAELGNSVGGPTTISSEKDQATTQPIVKKEPPLINDIDLVSEGDRQDGSTRPAKRRRMSSPSIDTNPISLGNADAEILSGISPSTTSSTRPPTTNLTTMVTLRSSPSRSSRPLPSIGPPRPRLSNTTGPGKTVQLTLAQSLQRFKKDSTALSEPVAPVDNDSEDDLEDEDMVIDSEPPPPPPQLDSPPRRVSRRDGIQTLVPPITSLPASLPVPDPDTSFTLTDGTSATSSPQTSTPASSSQPATSTPVSKALQAPPVEIVRNHASQGTHVKIDLNNLSSVWKAVSLRESKVSPTKDLSSSTKLRDAGVSAKSEAEAEKALSRVISKDDFREGGMSVVGQFNLGFIIARLDKGKDDRNGQDTTDDLFIIDQHAADEKYNFETLQQTTKIQSQRLLKPRPLGLAASDEIIAIERLEILRANGFEVNFTEEAPVGQRLHLISQPQSKTTVFDMKDLEELLNLMQDQPAGQMVRCSKARAMFASRACRKSTMVGKPLTNQQMTLIIRQMAILDQPWSCPHGRPTMRHLVDLRDFVTTASLDSKHSRRAHWSNFL